MALKQQENELFKRKKELKEHQQVTEQQNAKKNALFIIIPKFFATD